MANITLKGNPVQTSGELPAVGSEATGFRLVGTDLKDLSLHDFAGQRKVLNIFPSVDTPTCAMSVRQFNQRAAGLKNTAVLCISADLPFAQSRFCGAEGIGSIRLDGLLTVWSSTAVVVSIRGITTAISDRRLRSSTGSSGRSTCPPRSAKGCASASMASPMIRTAPPARY